MIICGTGHRPNKLGGYGPRALQVLTDVAKRALDDFEPKVVISRMALGWDQALAFAALKSGIPFLAYVPFMGQERIWPKASQDTYNHLLCEALEVVVCCEGEYHPSKMQIGNQRMVDDSDKVIALWDGSKGGTANCIAYAEKVGKPIENYWDVFKSY